MSGMVQPFKPSDFGYHQTKVSPLPFVLLQLYYKHCMRLHSALPYILSALCGCVAVLVSRKAFLIS